MDPVPGTDFGVVYPLLPPIRSGQAIGALVAGIVSILVSLVMICFGVAGAQAGWGALVAGAFAILGLLLGVAAIGTGLVARRSIRRSDGAISGGGLARAGMICGTVGAGLTVAGFAVSLVATLAS